MNEKLKKVYIAVATFVIGLCLGMMLWVSLNPMDNTMMFLAIGDGVLLSIISIAFSKEIQKPKINPDYGMMCSIWALLNVVPFTFTVIRSTLY